MSGADVLQSLGGPGRLQGLVSNGDLAKARGAQRAAESGEADAEAVGRRFEELFATMLVREMRKSASGINPEGGFFGKGAGADVYEGWFDEHVGRELAARDSLGLVGMVKAGIARTQATEEQAA